MRRSYVAFFTAALIFVLTYLSAWGTMRNLDMMTLGYANFIYLYMDMHYQNQYLSEYVQKNEQYPDSIDDLKQFIIQEESGSPEHASRLLTDPWDHPFQYEKTDKGYRLWSLGRTGKPGGVGMDAEIECNGKNITFPTPTPFQFVFEGKGSLTLFLVALAASCSAGFIWYTRQKPPDGERLSRIRLMASVIFVTISAVVIAIFLTGLYLAMQQTGH